MPLALRFISGRYQGGEFPLDKGKEVILGRASELDMVLVEEMVSRHHARIAWSGDSFFIEDLGSTNGTFVNGEKIERRDIQEGDRILVGTSILKVVEATHSIRAAQFARRDRPDTPPEQEGPPRMTGSLSEVSLPDLLQLFAASRKSGVLSVRAEGQAGHLHLKEGDLRFATIEGRTKLASNKAVYRMLRWTDGHFQLDPPEDEEFETPIAVSLQELLMEGCRQMDEIANLGGELPADGAKLSLPVPLKARFKELGPEHLDALQLCLTTESFGDALDESPQTDVETSRAVAELLDRGYLVATES